MWLSKANDSVSLVGAPDEREESKHREEAISKRKKRECIQLAFLLILAVWILSRVGGFLINVSKKTRTTTLSKTTERTKKGTSNSSRKWDSLWAPHILTGKSFYELANASKYGKSLKLSELFNTIPLPRQKNTIEIYNEKAHRELIRTFLSKQKKNLNFTICASGGSTTAGAGGITQENRYYSKLADYLGELINDQDRVTAIGAGHGARTSLHTANWFANFIPPEVDLLTWEFATNDYAIHLDGINGTNPMEDEKNNVLAWLYEVEKRKPKPPKVILIYFWQSPFEKGDDGKVKNRVFESHQKVAAEFPFVIGHVNMASYVDELTIPSECTSFENCDMLLADVHHPNEFGHLLASYLMLNFLKPRPTSPSLPNQLNRTRTKYTWACGNETEEKNFLQRLVTDSVNGWTSSLGSWTLEQPRLQNISSEKQLTPRAEMKTGKYGKADPIRQDRTRSVELNFCNGDPKNNTIDLVAPLSPLNEARVLLLVFEKHCGGFMCTGENWRKITELHFFLNDNMNTTPGTLLRVPKHDTWPCHWSTQWAGGKAGDANIFGQSYWYVFSEPQNISSISLCWSKGVLDMPPKMFSLIVR